MLLSEHLFRIVSIFFFIAIFILESTVRGCVARPLVVQARHAGQVAVRGGRGPEVHLSHQGGRLHPPGSTVRGQDILTNKQVLRKSNKQQGV